MAAGGILSRDFDELVPAQFALWEALKKLDTALPVWAASSGLGSSTGLAGLLYVRHQLAYEKQMEIWQRDTKAALPTLRRRNPTVELIVDSAPFRGMTTKLAVQAKRRGGRYTDGRALLWLLDATLHGLVSRMAYRVHGVTRREPTSEDWSRARQALKVLSEVRDLGIDLAPSWPNMPWLVVPADWPERLSAQLKERQLVVRPYADAHFPERKACEMFVRIMYAHFGGEVAPTLVQEFGDMIGWFSGRLPDRVRRWVAELNRR